MSRKHCIIWLAQFLLVLLVLFLLGFIRPLQINTNLAQIFPQPSVSAKLDRLIKETAQQTQNSNIVLLRADQSATVTEQASLISDWLANRQEVHISQAKFTFPSTDELVKSLVPHRHYLLSDFYANLLTQPESLYPYQFSLINQFSNPLIGSSFSSDPTLSIADYFMRLPSVGIRPDRNGYLYFNHENAFYGLVRFTTKTDGLDLASSANFVRDFKHKLEEEKLEAVYLGQVFYSEFAYQNARYEMMLFSVLSTLAVTLLIIIAYRSVASFIFTILTVGVSLMYGWLGLSLFFTEVHILSFVFAVTLIGIAADYCFHVTSTLRLSQQPPVSNVLSILKPLSLGLVSTLIGYLILFFSPFPLFAQVSTFVIFGLTGALYTSLVLGPAFIKPTPEGKKSPRIVAFSLTHFKNKRGFTLCSALLVIGVYISLGNIKFYDDVRSYYQVSESLSKAQTLVKALVKTQEDFQFFVIEGETEQQVLQREHTLVDLLTSAVEAQHLEGFKGVSQYVPTEKQQLENYTLVQAMIERGHLQPLGQLTGVSNWKLNKQGKPLTVATWLNTPIGQSFQQQWHVKEHDVTSVVKLQGVKNSEKLNGLCQQIEGCRYVDQANAISLQLAKFRDELTFYLAVSLIVVAILLSRIYGVLKGTMVVFLSMFAVALALVATQYLQGYVNIFNIMACVLIIALGLDYGIFYAEFGRSPRLDFTLTISALSSIFVFAILMLSNTPAIKNFGTTVFIGILATYLIAPLAETSNRKKNDKNAI